MSSIPSIHAIEWPAPLARKLERLEAQLQTLGSALVAFSGGVDSTFLAAVAFQVLRDRVLAVTLDSPVIPRRELQSACELARLIGIRHAIVPGNELESPAFRANPPDRCYHCKAAVFRRLRDRAAQESLAGLLDGTNTDDAGDYRPGTAAARELGVLSPLAQAGFSKQDIRDASRLLGLPTADKPAMACLASRFPFGQPITADVLARVEAAEAALLDLGFRQVRVRVHDRVARIELPESELARALSGPMRLAMAAAVHRAGFRYAALDLDGYRTGSMNPEP